MKENDGAVHSRAWSVDEEQRRATDAKSGRLLTNLTWALRELTVSSYAAFVTTYFGNAIVDGTFPANIDSDRIRKTLILCIIEWHNLRF